ncbi:homoserine kinase [Campylobacter troglodytis]|uniref:homoserine kinase n=1 Tax=Campylobacter troglodytis TaxID=654363 RepID=UPI00115B09B6|nr:homoserine kinase [Campylobacter troglodytis]TQR56005.1 homoserine kinase [Campylobacter troglodytis]
MKIKIPATSANLGPGFDCLGLSLNLHNEVQIKKARISSVKIKGEGEDNIYLKRNNPFLRLFDELYLGLTGEKSSFRFEFNNQIPLSRGLGSSSAVVVGAVVAAYAMAGKDFDKQGILNSALPYEKHPDNIAPATLGGFVCSVVESSQVFSIKSEIDNDLRAVMVIPNAHISTKKSRANLPKSVHFKDAVFNLAHSSFLTACFLQKRYDLLRLASIDTLHQNTRMKNLPALFKVQKLALEKGALMSVLSGSGSSFLNIIYKNEAKTLAQKLQNEFKDFKIKIMEFDNKGFEIC